MTLHGTSETFEFGEILHVIADRRKTGRLAMRAGNTEGAFFFDQGRLCGMTGRGTGTITPSVDGDGPSSWPDTALDLAASMLRASHTSFVFEPGMACPEGSTIRARVNGLLTEAHHRMEQWRGVEENIPSLDARPALLTDVDHQVALEPDEWRVLVRIDGRHTVSALARVTGTSSLDTCKLLIKLVNLGLVKLEAAAAPVAVASEIADVAGVDEGVVAVGTAEELPKFFPPPPAGPPSPSFPPPDQQALASATPGPGPEHQGSGHRRRRIRKNA